jgi:hypothetical protein
MEITVQQKGDIKYGVEISRRNFKLKNGFYENSAYNDGGVPTHWIIIACMQEPDTHKWDDTQQTVVEVPRSKEVQDYMDEFYPNWDKNPGSIILGETNSDEIHEKDDENRYHYLQEMAIELAEEKGLIPEYTLLDIAECNYTVTLYGDKNYG